MLAVLLEVHQCFLFQVAWVLKVRVFVSVRFIGARIGAQVCLGKLLQDLGLELRSVVCIEN